MKIDWNFFTKIRGIPTSKTPIKSIAHYLEVVEFLKTEFDEWDLWFRGVPKDSYRLVPRIYRSDMREYDHKEANWTFEAFVNRGRAFVDRHESYTKWQWYQLMQHYGMPTRLLDWSRGALIGLYFAVREPSRIGIPAVYILEPFWLDRVAHGGGFIYTTNADFLSNEDAEKLSRFLPLDSLLPEFPMCIEPPAVDPRIVAQKSTFTVHGSRKHAFEQLCQKHKRAHLVQIRFSTRHAKAFCSELNTMGITESSVFPDLEGVAREIIWDYGLP